MQSLRFLATPPLAGALAGNALGETRSEPHRTRPGEDQVKEKKKQQWKLR